MAFEVSLEMQVLSTIGHYGDHSALPAVFKMALKFALNACLILILGCVHSFGFKFFFISICSQKSMIYIALDAYKRT